MFYKSEITSLLLKRIFTFFSKNKSDIRKFTAFWIFEIPIFENLEKITPRIKKKNPQKNSAETRFQKVMA